MFIGSGSWSKFIIIFIVFRHFKMSLSKMDHLSDEVSLEVYSYLEVKDLLVMRKVSARHHARLAMDKKLWKFTRIFMNELFRDKEYFTREEKRENPSMMEMFLAVSIEGK